MPPTLVLLVERSATAASAQGVRLGLLLTEGLLVCGWKSERRISTPPRSFCRLAALTMTPAIPACTTVTSGLLCTGATYALSTQPYLSTLCHGELSSLLLLLSRCRLRVVPRKAVEGEKGREGASRASRFVVRLGGQRQQRRRRREGGYAGVAWELGWVGLGCRFVSCGRSCG